MARRVQVRYEQAVYGSFPFWDRGYAILAHSPGCRPEWLAGLCAACQRIGERPAGTAEARGLFALRPDRGPWMIVGVGPQGRDDRGRPGALAFHALFVDPRDYLRAGSGPFDFAAALRHDWTAETRTLAAGALEVEPPERSPGVPADRRAGRIAAVLSRGGRVALEAAAPIDDLARDVWLALPPAVRDRASVATWAFGNGNRFDLVALPRLAGVELDPSYLTAEQLDADPTTGPPGPGGRPAHPFGGPRLRRVLPWLGVASFVLGVGAALSLRRGAPDQAAPSPSATDQGRSSRPAAGPDRPPPPRPDVRDEGEPDPEERRRVTEGLVDMAERFGVLDDNDAAAVADDATGLMVLLAGRLRYRGPWLSARELASLAAAPGHDHDHDLARKWHAQVRKFAPDRPLPADFSRGSLRWQLDTLAWSFHVDEDPGAPLRSPAERVHALADALTPDAPLPWTALTARSPSLAAYRAFLGKLPRR